MQKFPEHGMCFVCGSENPNGMGVQWIIDDDKSLFAEHTLSQYQQGPPGHAHGGASASLLDEAMGLCVWAAGYRVLAVNININYKRMVPLGEPIIIRGRVDDVSGRTIRTTGEITLQDGTVAVTGTGIYVESRKAQWSKSWTTSSEEQQE